MARNDKNPRIVAGSTCGLFGIVARIKAKKKRAPPMANNTTPEKPITLRLRAFATYVFGYLVNILL
jgi:hypothetical protein